MSQMTPPRRGRPKGTGIDDRPRLREIAAIIVRQPQIRPTTAIKLLGENDPSVIRRLRDKFHALQSELMADVRRAAAEQTVGRTAQQSTIEPTSPPELITPPAKAPEVTAGTIPTFARAAIPVEHELTQLADSAATKIAAISMAGRGAPPPTDTAPATRLHSAPADLQPRSQPVPASEGPNPYDALVGLTIEATVTAIEQQMRIYEQALRIPTVALMLRNQIAVSEALMNIACTAIRANRAIAAAA